MRASGVALAGAQQTLKLWSQRKAPDPETDGILTAEEVASLNLDGTWLVTLSACETGVGEARSGEGVFGLRRAFMIAGAENLLMTLWPVADDTTASIMADFYKEALVTGDAPGSLAKVQRDWLVKLRQEKGLAAAIREAGPFAMVVMANPNAKSPAEVTTRVPSSTSSVVPVSCEQRSSDFSPTATTEMGTFPPSRLIDSTGILEFEDALDLADAGDARGQAIVAIYYGLGYKTEKDLAKAAEYAAKSSKQQNPLGQYQFGVLMSGGDGVEKDPEKGKKLKLQAIEGLNTLANDPYALAALGSMALRGEGVSKNMQKAAKLYKESADLGYAPAQVLYATMLSAGVGAPKDSEKADIYSQKAKEQNYHP
jgi:TPR repeat protein